MTSNFEIRSIDSLKTLGFPERERVVIKTNPNRYTYYTHTLRTFTELSRLPIIEYRFPYERVNASNFLISDFYNLRLYKRIF